MRREASSLPHSAVLPTFGILGRVSNIWKKFIGFEIGNNKHFAFEPRGLSLKVRGLPLTPHALLKVIGSSRTSN